MALPTTGEPGDSVRAEFSHEGGMAAGANIAPLPAMLIGAALALLLILMALMAVLNQPWMGVTLDADPDSGYLHVVALRPDSAAEGLLKPGARITALENPVSGERTDLHGFVPGIEPPSLPTYAAHNALLAREGRLAAALEGTAVILVQADGSAVSIPVDNDRPLSAVPLDFWLFNLFGTIAWTVSLAVWAARPRQLPARLLAMSGAGFFFATLFNSVYLSRELALPESAFLFLSRMNHLALAVMLVSLLALMAYYPRRLTRISPAVPIVFGLVFYQLNEQMQWVEWPLHAYYMPIMALYLVGILVAMRQWHLSRDQPLDRAALKWLFLSIFVVMGMGLAIYFVPIAFTGAAFFPQSAMVGVASMLYIGFAFGVLRYRLFDLERWWFRIWVWFFGGLAVVAFDLLLIAMLGMQPVVALGVAVIAVGWLYFPLRQWAWQAMSGRASASPENSLVEMVELISSAVPTGSTDLHWRQLLQRLYEPAGVLITPEFLPAPRILDNGAVMEVPLLSGKGAVALTFADRGRRLFAPGDVEHAAGLLTVSRRVMRVRLAEIEAARAERDRIMRDLHDDVGGRILSLLRNAPDEKYEALARNALQSLRETMHALDENVVCRLDDCIDDWHADCLARCREMNVPMQWRQVAKIDDMTVSIRHHINVRRILSEALTNAFRHARPDTISVEISGDEAVLSIEVINNGLGEHEAENNVLAGRGLNHMRTRAEELGGLFSFQFFEDVARVRATIPLT
ncbi:hypothetical protein K8B33_06415 [Alcanivorax sp. JB21]|uniref:ATP-binding protein n=1 Tax=Alcanivorax limicola TaxID=2874102 RepID=UPI001CC13F58|nr:ATP-binding protein [Alcanivorax limicola]MBZ2188720.1 hypothetical protein [Alcanivorax limicola]